MRRNLLIIASVLLAIVIAPILLRKNVALLGVQGGKKIVAARSLIPNLNAGMVDVYAGEEKLFSLGEDWFDGPQFIHPFADGRRFFCDYNYDTAILDFVVDLDASHTNLTANWPSDYEVRRNLAQFATNVVFNTTGVVRLPTDEELDEVRSHLTRASTSQIKASSFPYCDFGIFLGYMGKDRLLLDLAANRQNYWPMP